MKTLSILVPAAVAGVLRSAMVLQAGGGKVSPAAAPDRAAAYALGTAA